MAEIKKGDIVEVFNQTAGGIHVFEGYAKLIRCISKNPVGLPRWTVRFQKGGMICHRYIIANELEREELYKRLGGV